MSQNETVERSIALANRLTYSNWVRLFGEAVSAPAAEPDTIGKYFQRVRRAGGNPPDSRMPEYFGRSVGRFRAALSDIVHERQTRAQLEAWHEEARRLTPTPTRTIEGKRVRETIQWSAPREVFELPNLPELHFVTVDAESVFSTVLMWLLNPELSFNGQLHECHRGEQCERERFFFRNRKYCCSEHTLQVNRLTNTERSRDRRARDKAVKLLKPRFPKSAKDLVRKVKAPGLTADQLVERALAAAERHTNGRSR